ncbi:hypothetical protein KCP74_16165 [Salmonella enterica subsp. enterica]|nr:hypothetical protein KCP74_16165 [Salmonella enterica subsp. enterica]
MSAQMRGWARAMKELSRWRKHGGILPDGATPSGNVITRRVMLRYPAAPSSLVSSFRYSPESARSPSAQSRQIFMLRQVTANSGAGRICSAVNDSTSDTPSLLSDGTLLNGTIAAYCRRTQRAR